MANGQLRRLWRYWFQTILLSTQDNPPRFVELVMLSLAMLLILGWGFSGKWPFLVLSLSYVLGSSVSVLVRETFLPSAYPRLVQLTAVVLIFMSVYILVELVGYL